MAASQPMLHVGEEFRRAQWEEEGREEEFGEGGRRGGEEWRDEDEEGPMAEGVGKGEEEGGGRRGGRRTRRRLRFRMPRVQNFAGRQQRLLR